MYKIKKEWVVVGLNVIVLAAIFFIKFNHHSTPPVTREITQPKPYIVTKQTPNPYLSPNKEQAEFGDYHTVGEIGYQVYEGNSTRNGKTIIEASYGVRYSNLLNRPQALSRSPRLNVGCIAAGNQNFKQKPIVFGQGNFQTDKGYSTTSLTAFDAGNNTLPAFGSTVVIFEVNGDCQFIGTQDGQYWWKVQ